MRTRLFAIEWLANGIPALILWSLSRLLPIEELVQAVIFVLGLVASGFAIHLWLKAKH